MYRCEVIANQSVQDELVTLLEEHIEGCLYTIIPMAVGRGKNSYKMGSSTWPETNFVLITYIQDEFLPMVKNIVASLKSKFVNEGVKLFVVKAED